MKTIECLCGSRVFEEEASGLFFCLECGTPMTLNEAGNPEFLEIMDIPFDPEYGFGYERR